MTPAVQEEQTQLATLLALPHLDLALFTLQLVRNYERALDHAAKSAVSERQRDAASNKHKPNALKVLVASIIQERPERTTAQILDRIRSLEMCSVVEEVNEEAGVITWQCPHRGRLIDTPISALPSMASRVRKTLRAENAPEADLSE